VSGQCHNLCSKKPKSLKMYVEAGRPVYLCAKCARELGYGR
jgi:hypothetical protein